MAHLGRPDSTEKPTSPLHLMKWRHTTAIRQLPLLNASHNVKASWTLDHPICVCSQVRQIAKNQSDRTARVRYPAGDIFNLRTGLPLVHPHPYFELLQWPLADCLGPRSAEVA